ncbi:hypothetical protein [Ureibacillus aquaedulcis]|uniref:Lipoprotein n=1 Tax=Ureibacillus aquaedulcis TaxID=3058421 RepID=A0ABT8GPV9_9BACL|nr:hypothetical protein [Ureibacillus sp. BA0131]MDN4493447.1 hypothetical protein [Ureibacillus sp. BA0131]
MYKSLFSLILLLLVSGCSNGAQLEPSNGISHHHLLPPTVELEIEDSTYSTEQGSYCWRNENSAECLSLASPIEIAENIEPIKVPVNKTISLLPKRQPSQQTLAMTNVESEQDEEIPLNKDNQFKAPKTAGVYIFNYYAIWEKDDTETSGDSSYIFKIEVDK